MNLSHRNRIWRQKKGLNEDHLDTPRCPHIKLYIEMTEKIKAHNVQNFKIVSATELDGGNLTSDM